MAARMPRRGGDVCASSIDISSFITQSSCHWNRPGFAAFFCDRDDAEARWILITRQKLPHFAMRYRPARMIHDIQFKDIHTPNLDRDARCGAAAVRVRIAPGRRRADRLEAAPRGLCDGARGC